MLEVVKKIFGYGEWLAFTGFVAMMGCYAFISGVAWLGVLIAAVAVAMVWFMVAAASPRHAPQRRFPANIPVGSPVVYALLGYFSYEAWLYEPVWKPLLVSVMAVVAIGFLRWVISLLND